MLTKHSGLVAATLAALLTAACGASEPPEPTEGPSSDTASTTAQEPPLTAEAALGDLTAVDFCALLDEKALGTALEKADAEVDFTVPGFQHCSIGVTATTSLWVSVGDLFDNSDNVVWPSEDVEVSRSLRRQSIEIEDDGCVRALTFADDITLQITAVPPTDVEHSDHDGLCEVADAVTDAVQTTVLSEAAPTQSFRPGSLAESDACELLDEAGVPALFEDGVESYEHLDNHGCSLGSGLKRATVELSFGVDLTDLSEFTTTIAGRPTEVRPLEYGCRVSTPHIRFSESRPHEREMVTLSTVSFDPDRCESAEWIAELLWPKLPAFRG